MFTQRNTENERGALMIEAIALLGLMTMMSPMVVRQTAERTSEMEEVAIAGQMKELRDGLSNYIEANYGSLTGNKTQNEVRTDITASMLAPFLPAGAVQDGKFLGNKMVYNSADSDATSPFKVATTAQCTERKNGGTTQVCATPGGCALGGGWTCNRYRITGLVLSNGAEELDDRRASRIASMIGADGGFMRSSKANTALAATNEAKRKIYGAQGIWEGDTDVFFGAGNIDADRGGRIAATTVFTSGASGDFLYRTQQDGIPGANSMFTDLDMGGNHVNCGGDGQPACHKINNAGGLEVVNGRILVRPANNNVQPGAEGTVGDARVSLAADQSHISAGLTNISINSGNIRLDTGHQPGGITINSDQTLINGGSFSVNTSRIIDMTAQRDISMTSQSGGISITSTAGEGSGNIWIGTMAGDIRTDSRNINMSAHRNARFSVAQNVWISSGSNTSISSGDNISISSINDTSLYGGNVIITADGVGGGFMNTYVNGDMETRAEGEIFARTKENFRFEASSDPEDAWQIGGAMSLSKNYGSMSVGHFTQGYSSLTMDYERIGLKRLAYFDGVTSDIALTNDGTFLNLVSQYQGKYSSTNMFMGNRKITQMVYNNSAGTNLSNNAFRLYVGRKFELNGAINDSALSLFNLNSSTAEIIVTNAKMKLDSSIAQFEIGSSNMHLNSEGLFIYKKYANEQIPAISLNATSGRIDGGYFTVNKIYNPYNNGGRGYWVNPIMNWRKMSTYDNGFATNDPLALVNLNQTGFTNKGMVRMNTSSANVNGAYDATAGQDKFLFNKSTNSSKSYVNNFRVDPAFVSVMNDIRLTSRGGAKLSHALPNYILKGIYILTNSYTDGGWPCGDGPSTCSYNMPYFTAEELGLGRGGYEFHCTGDDVGGSNPVHPMMGKCVDHVTASQKYVEFSYPKNDNYKEYRETCGRTDDACWAHPFMGVVPVPGRSITIKLTTGDETLYAHDEGECPDGYMPVMTVTPTIFELGRVNAIKRSIAAAGQVYLSNPGYQNFVNNETYKFVNIYQMGTKLGIVTKPICDYDSASNTGDLRHATCKSGNRTLKGWAIAMGTVTQDNVHPGNYIWNVGGVYTNSWQATAHTYCYFNPARFIMPNMTSYGSDSRTQTSQENPILNSSKRGLMMDEYD